MLCAPSCKGTTVRARTHLVSVPTHAIQTKRPPATMRRRYHVDIIATVAVFMLGAGLWMRSGSQAAVHDPVMEEAQIRTTTAMVAYFPALYINQQKLTAEHITAYWFKHCKCALRSPSCAFPERWNILMFDRSHPGTGTPSLTSTRLRYACANSHRSSGWLLALPNSF